MDSGAEVKSDPRRALPALGVLLQALTGRRPELPGWALREGARRALGEERARLGALRAADPASAADLGALEMRAERCACEFARPHPGRVVNATEIALHTNLGRAPLAEAALDAVVRAARGYCDLEIDLARGSRSSRTDSAVRKLCLASGAAGALVVNDNAAALLLALAALDATLDAYLVGRADREVPTLRQLLEGPDALERRARSLAQNLEAVAPRALQIEVAKDHSFAGGDSLPGFELPTWVVSLRAPAGAARFAEQLRRAAPPVLARIRDDLVLLDVRTLLDGDEKALEQALRAALR